MSLNEETRGEILKALKNGMPQGNAADLVRISRAALEREMADDPNFAAMVNHAIAVCMNDRLEKLAGLKNWQALAFILQSLWPERFGRRSRGRRQRKRRGPPPGGQLNFAHLTGVERQQLDLLLAKAHGRNGLTGSGERVQIENEEQPPVLH